MWPQSTTLFKLLATQSSTRCALHHSKKTPANQKWLFFCGGKKRKIVKMQANLFNSFCCGIFFQHSSQIHQQPLHTYLLKQDADPPYSSSCPPTTGREWTSCQHWAAFPLVPSPIISRCQLSCTEPWHLHPVHVQPRNSSSSWRQSLICINCSETELS